MALTSALAREQWWPFGSYRLTVITSRHITEAEGVSPRPYRLTTNQVEMATEIQGMDSATPWMSLVDHTSNIQPCLEGNTMLKRRPRVGLRIMPNG